jgi:hypothetical protein
VKLADAVQNFIKLGEPDKTESLKVTFTKPQKPGKRLANLQRGAGHSRPDQRRLSIDWIVKYRRHVSDVPEEPCTWNESPHSYFNSWSDNHVPHTSVRHVTFRADTRGCTKVYLDSGALPHIPSSFPRNPSNNPATSLQMHAFPILAIIVHLPGTTGLGC